MCLLHLKLYILLYTNLDNYELFYFHIIERVRMMEYDNYLIYEHLKYLASGTNKFRSSITTYILFFTIRPYHLRQRNHDNKSRKIRKLTLFPIKFIFSFSEHRIIVQKLCGYILVYILFTKKQYFARWWTIHKWLHTTECR